MPFMYILRCRDNSYYVGSTRNLEQRLAQHQAGHGAQYTRRRLPVVLAYAAEFARIEEAFSMEKRVQGWSRAKREALIDGRHKDIPSLARKRFPSAE